METIIVTREHLLQALERLHEATTCYKLSLHDTSQIAYISHEKLTEFLRDSLIKRFKLCTDFFGKYLLRYEEEILAMTPEIIAPKQIIRAACKAKLLSEQDSEQFLEMFNDRNVTSHMYRDDIADHLSAKIPAYYQLMKKYVDQLDPNAHPISRA